MTLNDAHEGKEYIVKDILTDDEETKSFLFNTWLLQRGANHGYHALKSRSGCLH